MPVRVYLYIYTSIYIYIYTYIHIWLYCYVAAVIVYSCTVATPCTVSPFAVRRRASVATTRRDPNQPPTTTNIDYQRPISPSTRTTPRRMPDRQPRQRGRFAAAPERLIITDYLACTDTHIHFRFCATRRRFPSVPPSRLPSRPRVPLPLSRTLRRVSQPRR